MKLTKLGQGGAGPWAPGTTCRFLVPRGLAGLPAPGTTCRVAPRQLIWGLAQGPRARTPGVGEKEKNGYPFTTFTDFSDFLGIILRVLSDDLATMLTTKHSGEGIH